jgi:Secretion system C-terminal sorting domain/Beta-propeller repeat
MKKIFNLLVLLFMANISFGQTLKYEWHKIINSDTFGSSEANGICAQGLTTYAIGTVYKDIYFRTSSASATYQKTNSASKDVYITKQKDTILWRALIGGSDDETGNDIATDLQGNLYCVGTFNGAVDFDPGIGIDIRNAVGASDIFILKMDTLGNFLWVQTIGGLGNETPNKIRINNNGEIIVAGYFENSVDFDPNIGVVNLTSYGNKDMFIISLSNVGALNWAKQIGGIGNDEIQSLFVKNNLIYCSGYFEDIVDFNTGSSLFLDTAKGATDAFVLSLDSVGTFVNEFSIKGSNFENASGVTLDSLNNIIVVGSFKDSIDINSGAGVYSLSSLGGKDAFLAKYTNSGNFTLGFSIGNVAEIEIKDVISVSNNKIVVCGQYQGLTDFNPGSAINYQNLSGGFVAYYTALGAYDWAATLQSYATFQVNSPYSELKALCKSNSNAFVAGAIDLRANGTTGYRLGKINYSNNNFPVYDYIVAEPAPSETAKFIGTDSIGNVYTSGSFSYSTDLDPSTGIDLKESPTFKNAYIQKLDSNGAYLFTKHFENVLFDDMFIDNSGNQFVVGRYSGYIDLDPSLGISSFLSGPNKTNGFFAKYDQFGNLVFSKNLENYSSNNNSEFFKIVTDFNGNIFISATSAIYDFDPSANVDTNLVTTNSYGMLIKYDLLGNFLWVKPTGGVPKGLKIDYANKLIIYGGVFNGTAPDYDPGVGVVNLPIVFNAEKVFLSKWDNNGQFIFAKGWDGNITSTVNFFIALSDVAVDSLNNLFVLLGSNALVDVDPGTNFIASNGQQFVIKLNTNGDYLWHKAFIEDATNVSYTPQRSIAIDKKWNIVFTRRFQYLLADYDPSPTNVFYLNGNGYTGFMYLDSAGKFLMAKSLKGNNSWMGISDIVITANNNLFACGDFKDSIDFSLQQGTALTSSKLNIDAFVLKLGSCNNVTTSSSIINSCGPYSINNTNINSSGNYTFLYLNASNCDSLVTYNISIGAAIPPTNVNVINCGTYSYNGSNYISTGLYKDTLNSVNGCDSIINLNLTINPTYTNTVTLSDCKPIIFNQITYTNSGVYYDSLLSVAGCDSITQININITAVPIANFVNASNTLTAVTPSLTYQWVNCNDGISIIPGQTNMTFSPTQSGNYALIQGNGNCSDTSECKAFIPLTIINQQKDDALKIIPNPASKTVTIINQQPAYALAIYNTLGNKMLVDIVETSQDAITIDVSSFANGVYVIMLNGKKAKLEVLR